MSRILVVDDDPQILRTLQINLRARGHQVDTAAHGAAALAEAVDTDPELIVLDLGLPDMDGVEVIRRLRRTQSSMAPFSVWYSVPSIWLPFKARWM